MTARIIVGDCRERLKDLADGSVHMCCTSPPYMGLRSYSDDPAEIGKESTLAAYIAALVETFREVRRVLRDDGTLWLNIGDSYATKPNNNAYHGKGPDTSGLPNKERQAAVRTPSKWDRIPDGLKAKDLMMVPARVALALQDDGWWLRSDIIWAKTAPMPESVTDRPTSAHEHIFMLSKRPTYFYDQEAVREPHAEATLRSNGIDPATGRGYRTNMTMTPRDRGIDKDEGWGNMAPDAQRSMNPNGRNLRNVWTLGPDPFPDAHFATFPREIPRRCIKAGTSERGVCAECGAPWVRVVERQRSPVERRPKAAALIGNGDWHGDNGTSTLSGPAGSAGWSSLGPGVVTTGWRQSCSCYPNEPPVPATVLDPFLGSGTTLLVADQLGRDGVGIELNPTYAAMSEARIRNDAPMFANVAMERVS